MRRCFSAFVGGEGSITSQVSGARFAGSAESKVCKKVVPVRGNPTTKRGARIWCCAIRGCRSRSRCSKSRLRKIRRISERSAMFPITFRRASRQHEIAALCKIRRWDVLERESLDRDIRGRGQAELGLDRVGRPGLGVGASSEVRRQQQRCQHDQSDEELAHPVSLSGRIDGRSGSGRPGGDPIDQIRRGRRLAVPHSGFDPHLGIR